MFPRCLPLYKVGQQPGKALFSVDSQRLLGLMILKENDVLVGDNANTPPQLWMSGWAVVAAQLLHALGRQSQGLRGAAQSHTTQIEARARICP